MATQSGEQGRKLESEIRAIKREIAELSALLALKKLENDHPALLKLAEEIDKAGSALASGKDRLVGAAEYYWPKVRDNEPVLLIARAAVLGGIAWLAAWLLGWAGPHRR